MSFGSDLMDIAMNESFGYEAVNEFKADEKAYYGNKRMAELSSGSHNSEDKKQHADDITSSKLANGEKLSNGKQIRPATTAAGKDKRDKLSNMSKDISDTLNDTRDWRRENKQKEAGTSGNSNDRKRENSKK